MITGKSHRSVKRLLLALVCSIFIGETLVMLFIEQLPPLLEWHKALLDSTLLLTLTFPAIYLLVFRPLRIQLTKIKQAEKIQHEALDRLRKISAQVPGIVFQLQMWPNHKLCIPYANDGLLKIYRINPEDVREDASAVFTVVHPEDIKNHLASIKISSHNLTPWVQEYRLKFGDEPDCWLFVNALPQRLADGSTLWHGFITDITKRKQTEYELFKATYKLEEHQHELEMQHNELQRTHSALEESRDRFVDLFDFAPLGYLTLNDQGCITEINLTGAKLLGADRNKLKQRQIGSFLFFTPWEYDQWWLNLSTQKFNDKQSYELEIRRDDSTVFQARLDCQLRETLISPIVHVSFADITERKQAKIELQIAAIAFESQEGMVITDMNNVIVKVNQAFIRLTGYSSEELINRKMKLLKSGRHDAEFYSTMWQSLVHTGTWQGEIWNRLKNGEIHPQFVTITAVKNNDGEIFNYVANYTDITERKAIEERVNQLAFYDSLTQLPNRVLLADRMQQTLAHCCRNQEIAAICMLDLDGFKHVNDTLGHAAGDQLLCDVAQRLQECIRREDTAARFGGDEFALLLGGFSKISECEQTLERIVTSIAAPYRIFGQTAHISASIGVTLFPEDSSDPDLLLRHADQVMYEVKQSNKNGYQLFNTMHAKRAQTTQDFYKKIGEALVKGQFELYYQPLINCRQGKVVGAEALVRWNHPILGVLSPSEFVPVIEHDDMIIALGEWTLQEALRQLVECRKAGFDFQISVNISARQLRNNEFPQRLKEMLTGYDAEIIERLEIEIVETAALEDVIVGGDAIRKCRAMGVRVALDDFGTGFSSLAHLKHLSADTLKIDLSFVSGMLKTNGDIAIVEGVIGLAASFRLQVIAEGVEYVDQVLMLLELGCDVMQGYGLARPMPAKQLHTWLAGFMADPLWSLSASHLTSRNYFELLQAEANHRYWTEQVLANLDDPRDRTTPESLLNYRQCRFGQWYYTEGANYFHGLSEFHELDEIHQNIHRTAARLLENHRANLKSEVDAEKTQLQTLQHNMISHLQRLRIMLADELLK
ncbi:MAG: EAL domain-containing protein [Methylobacter sp.]|nr:EAL domain-containing protein [Methylobacter sp.]